MKTLKKWGYATVLLLAFLLTACSDKHYMIEDAKVIDKSYQVEDSLHVVTVTKNNSPYTFYVTKRDYDMVRNGSVVDVRVENNGNVFSKLYPSERTPKATDDAKPADTKE